MRQNKKGQGKAIILTLHQNKPQQGQMRHEVRLGLLWDLKSP